MTMVIDDPDGSWFDLPEQEHELAGIARQAARAGQEPPWPMEGDPSLNAEPDSPEEQFARLAYIRLAASHPDASPDGWPEPEDRGLAVLSALGDVEYAEDLVRPGRILAWAAEEGTGKSYAVTAELAMRIAIAGGSFAGTWPILRTGPVLVLSEMHPDDDFDREETTLASLGLERSALAGRYYRLSLITAAGGQPALTVEGWRAWVTTWLRDHAALLLVVDTATGATQVDPWGKAIQEVYTNLRVMIDAYPALAVILLLHLKKPQGRGERRISDVLGEWGRWCDVVVIQENDGASLSQTKITTRKRVRHQRRIIATKAGGLLVDPIDADAGKGTKIPAADVLAIIVERPGISLAELGQALGVSKDTAGNYAAALESDGLAVSRKVGPRRTKAVYAVEGTAEPPNTAERAAIGGDSAVKPPSTQNDRRSPNDSIEFGGRSSVVSDDDETIACADYPAHQMEHRRVTGRGWVCPTCHPELVA